MISELDRFLEDPESRRLFEQERLILDITESICAVMNERDVSLSELARRLGCSASNVSQMLDGENNFTVRTVADILMALESRLTVKVERISATADNAVPITDEIVPVVSSTTWQNTTTTHELERQSEHCYKIAA